MAGAEQTTLGRKVGNAIGGAIGRIIDCIVWIFKIAFILLIVASVLFFLATALTGRMPFLVQLPFLGSLPGGSPAPTLTVNYHTILVDSFRNPNAANALVSELKSKRIHARVETQNNIYYVVVGKYTSRSQAEGDLADVHQKGYPRARIVSP